MLTNNEKAQIHGLAVNFGRSRPGMKRTADRLAKCNMDSIIDGYVSRLNPTKCERFTKEQILNSLAELLWIEFCKAEINIQSQ